MTGELADMAALVNEQRKLDDRRGRLILRVGLDAHEVLTKASADAGHGSHMIAAVPIAEGTGLTYRQVEIEVDRDGGRTWRLIDDGEIVGQGEL